MSENYMEKMKELGISEEVVNQVLAVAKRMDDKGLVNSFAGNISAKVDGKIYITPTGQNKGLLTPEKIAVVNQDGEAHFWDERNFGNYHAQYGL